MMKYEAGLLITFFLSLLQTVSIYHLDGLVIFGGVYSLILFAKEKF